MLNTPFSPWPSYSAEEIEAVSYVLASNRVNYWTGEKCREFERRFADWTGTKHAIALANGTLALDVALKALGVGVGDEVITTPRTFVASGYTIVTAGAVPVFADVDADTQNITAATIEAVLTPRTKAIICVHLAGMPCDMDPIMALADRHGLVVIEDCAQAHGARYKGRPVGSMGHVGAWSFCQDKIMTTGGEGGMVTCQDDALWRRMWSYKDHGKSWEAVYERQHPPGFRWLHESFGTNWRMMEMQAALGRIQLGRMADWTARRTANAQIFADRLERYAAPDGPLRLPRLEQASYAEGSTHAYYRLYAYVRPDNLKDGWDRDRIVSEAASKGVPVMQGSCSEVYLEKAFDAEGLRPEKRLPNARELGSISIAFLVHPSLTPETVAKSAEEFAAILEEAALVG